MPRIWSVAPSAKICRKYPASVRRPVNVPMKNRRKIWKEPIQLTSAGARFRDAV